MEKRKLVIPNDIKAAFKEVGVKKGQAIMVHTSLSSLGYVCGGAQSVIEALLESVGEEGTIMMPTQSWKNLDPKTGVYWQEPEEWWDVIRENIPAYDKMVTPTNTMGVVPEMFRQWPGTLRSDHPARSVAAWGCYARYLTENHDLSDIFGDNSPIGRLYKLDGYVLLVGVGYDKNTSLHLADGQRIWKSYETLAVDGEDFSAIGEAFEQTGKVRHVPLGNGILSMMRQRELVDFAVKWIGENRK